MAHCCGCMITDTAGILSGKSPFEELEEELDRIGARKDVYIAFVLRWETVTDIDTWMIEPNGTAIGYNTPYKGQVQGVTSFNYVLDEVETTVNLNDPKLTSNKGNLDKDCVSCSPVGIENLVYFGGEYMQNGLYTYKIDDYSGNHSKGFKVYLVERNKRLEPVGFAEIVWEGAFDHEQALRENSQTMIQMCKSNDGLKFKLVHPHLRLVSSTGFNWVDRNQPLICNS